LVYDLWHGYRRLRHQGQAAAWPFGFGLSYSSFAHSEAAAILHSGAGPGGANESSLNPSGAVASGAVELTLSVRNSGAMAAAEVVQVYLEPPGRLMERPERTLVAFQRLHLEPGETRRLRLVIPLRRLACFAADRDCFVLEAGLHRLVVAPHAEAPGLAVALHLEATVLGP
jgi:beta-glucosidase